MRWLNQAFAQGPDKETPHAVSHVTVLNKQPSLKLSKTKEYIDLQIVKSYPVNIKFPQITNIYRIQLSPSIIKINFTIAFLIRALVALYTSSMGAKASTTAIEEGKPGTDIHTSDGLHFLTLNLDSNNDGSSVHPYYLL